MTWLWRSIVLVLLLNSAPSWCYSIDVEVDDALRAPNASSIVFELFTRLNPTTAQLLRLNDTDALQQSNYNASWPTKLFAHGWTAHPYTSAYFSRDAYLTREDMNFIAMDWSEIASGIDYPLIVARDVPAAAEHTAAFIEFLIENTGTSISSFHMMGHSLGAHIVGGAGAAVTSGKIPRITGLDPAGPWFSLNDTDSRLDVTDAEFVDILHTNAGTLTGTELGFFEPIGHVDFYPNGGQIQPGCHAYNVETGDHERNRCDHFQVVVYFAESINSEIGFRALQCSSYEDFTAGLCSGNPIVWMGDPTPSTSRGVYYLETNGESPYALG